METREKWIYFSFRFRVVELYFLHLVADINMFLMW